METVGCGFDRTLGIPFDEAVTRVTDALRAEGFVVLTEIDVKATLEKQLDVDPHLGSLLPCNVIVSIADPRAMFDLVGAEALKPVVAEADERLRRVLAALDREAV